MRKSLVLVILFFGLWMGVGAQTPAPLAERIRDIAWSPDGEMIAYSVEGNEGNCSTRELHKVSITNAVSGNVIRDLPLADCAFRDLDWSPDSTRLAGASGDAFGFRVWDVSNGQMVAIDKLGSQGMEGVNWHPYLDVIANYDISGSLILSDAQTGEIISVLQVSTTSASWNPDGTKLASVSYSESDVYITDVASGVIEQTLTGHTDTLFSVDWSPDGKKLVSVAYDEGVNIWDAQSGQLLRSLEISGAREAEWHPNSRQIAVAVDGSAQVWDAETGRMTNIYESAGRVYAVAWSPDGSQLAYGGEIFEEGETFTIVQPEILQPIPTPTPPVSESRREVITDLSWSPDRRYVAVGTGYWDENSRRCKSYGDPKITLIDTGRSTLRTIERTGVACQPVALSFSPDSTKLVLVADGEEVWDLQTETRIAWFGGAIIFTGARWSPAHQNILISSGNGSSVRVYLNSTDLSTNEVGLLRADVDTVARFIDSIWSPDGLQIATSSDDGRIYIWDPLDNTNFTEFGVIPQILLTFEGHSAPVKRLAWNPVSGLIASGDDAGNILIWDPQTGETVRHLTDHDGIVYDVAWSPGGQQLASAGADGTLRVWDDSTHRTEIIASGDIFTAVSYSPDGSQLAYGGAVGEALELSDVVIIPVPMFEPIPTPTPPVSDS